MPLERNKAFYDRIEDEIITILIECYPNIEVKAVGSRARGDFTRSSDLDIRFYFNGTNSTRERFYPRLIEVMMDELPNLNGERIIYDIGTSGNVVRVRPERGGKVDLVLVDPNYL